LRKSQPLFPLHLPGVAGRREIPSTTRHPSSPPRERIYRSPSFAFLEHYLFAGILSLAVIFLLIILFVTSANPATVVLGSLTSGGGLFVPNYKKVVWGLSLSAVAIVLLVTGGLASLQVMAITAAFPFMLVMLVLCYTLVIGLSQE